VDVNKVWTTVTTIILAFVFVFGNSIRNIYEAVIFLFVVHPFDVGDALLIGADMTWCQVNADIMTLLFKYKEDAVPLTVQSVRCSWFMYT
jgi:small-conductance mechanosensitive channel